MRKEIEFYTRPDGNVQVSEAGKAPYILDETCQELISELLDEIRTDYPDAHKALCEKYANSVRNLHYFEFLCVRMFVKCNWSQYDNKSDIDNDGNFMFEFCHCPLRGECKYWKIICEPTKSSHISPAEMNVLRLIVKGYEAADIADSLHISIFTVNTHRKNMLKRLELHNINQLVDYFHTNNLK